MVSLNEFTAHRREMDRKIDQIYKEAIEKHFGSSGDDVVKLCALYYERGVIRLQYGDRVLCEIYEPERHSPGDMTNFSMAASQPITLSHTVKYRIF